MEHKTKGNEVVNSIKGEIDQDEAGTVGHTYNPVFRCLRQEVHKFKAYLENIVSSGPACTKSIKYSFKKK